MTWDYDFVIVGSIHIGSTRYSWPSCHFVNIFKASALLADALNKLIYPYVCVSVSQPSECGRQHILISVHAQTAV